MEAAVLLVEQLPTAALGPLLERLPEGTLQELRRLLVGAALSGGNPRPHGGQIGAKAAGHLIGMGDQYMREHAALYGGVRHGDGPRARYRFDPARVLEGPTPDDRNQESPRPDRPSRRRSRQAAPRRTGTEYELLPIRGGGGA